MQDYQKTVEQILPELNRAMPASDEAEKGVLSCLLQDPEKLSGSLHTMPPAMFYHEGNRDVFTAMVDSIVEGRPIDPISLTHRLRSLGNLQKVGGAAAISELFSFMPISSHFAYYMGILKELFSQRKHIEAHARSLELLFAAKDGQIPSTLEDIKGILEEAGKMPGQLLKSHSLAQAIDPLLAEIEERSRNPGKLPGISTGFTTIDKHTGGMMPGQVWIFAGEPGDGKSTIMQNLAENAAFNGAKVRWYPLEMPHNEQTLRLLSSSSQVDNGNLYSGVLTNGQQQALQSAMRRLKNYKVELVDVEDASATDIFADIERSDCDIVVLDYLQLLDDTGARKSDTREGILASISRRQKRLARRTGKVILTASQLNDGGKLRESRAIGQDADKVFLVKKYADDQSKTGFDDERRTLWNDKNRGGKRHWELPLKFIGGIFQFREDEPT